MSAVNGSVDGTVNGNAETPVAGGHVLILGCGYVGKVIAQQWRDAGVTVTATTTSPDRVAELEAIAHRVLVLDATEPEKLREALEGQDTVLMAIGAKGPQDYRHAYLECAEAVAAVIPEFPAIQQIIYTSSYSAYGDYGGDWVTEETPLKPNTPNGEILAAAEQTILGINEAAAQSTGAIACVLRLGGICGPGREVVKILSRAAGMTRPGDGKGWAHWTHRDDVVGAIAWVRQQRLSGVFNVVQTEPILQKDLFEEALTKANLPGVTWDPNASNRKSYNVRVSNRRLRDSGYVMKYPT
ncbi:MAG: NAD-dependent epimerase/dehydratase family protein, partial [Cyanobacteria bacterium P01_D01_bin.73]